MSDRQYHRPTLFGPAAMDSRPGGDDPANQHSAAYQTALLLVTRGRDVDDPDALRRLVELADTEGLDLLAQLWADTPPDSLPGALWRVYLLRTWIRGNAGQVAADFDTGRRLSPVLEVVAGVAEPPGPDQVERLADAILHGVYDGDFAVALERAAAFTRIVAIGRAHRSETEHDTHSAARLVRTAENLEAAAAGWRRGDVEP